MTSTNPQPPSTTPSSSSSTAAAAASSITAITASPPRIARNGVPLLGLTKIDKPLPPVPVTRNFSMPVEHQHQQHHQQHHQQQPTMQQQQPTSFSPSMIDKKQSGKSKKKHKELVQTPHYSTYTAPPGMALNFNNNQGRSDSPNHPHLLSRNQHSRSQSTKPIPSTLPHSIASFAPVSAPQQQQQQLQMQFPQQQQQQQQMMSFNNNGLTQSRSPTPSFSVPANMHTGSVSVSASLSDINQPPHTRHYSDYVVPSSQSAININHTNTNTNTNTNTSNNTMNNNNNNNNNINVVGSASPSNSLASLRIQDDQLLKSYLKQASSVERSKIEYFVQMSLGTTAANLSGRNTELWTINNPIVNSNFYKKYRTHRVVDALFEVSQLDPHLNSLHSIVTNGFSVGEQGQSVFVGRIMDLSNAFGFGDFKSAGERSGFPRNKFALEFVLCKVAIGKMIPCAQKLFESFHGRVPALPPDHHSFYIFNESAGQQQSQQQSLMMNDNPSLHDSAQILPTHIMKIEVDPNACSTVENCYQCQKKPSVYYCEADAAYLCEECDKALHSASEILKRHVRILAQEKKRLDFEPCCYHPDLRVSYFCQHCQLPVCVKCKMEGNHSQGDANTHVLIPIKDAYERAAEDARMDDPLLMERRNTLADQMNQVEIRSREIDLHVQELNHLVQRIFEDIKTKIEQFYSQKTMTLSGETLELTAQLDEVEWIESFLQQQLAHSSPVQFLLAWQRHVQLRTQYYNGANRSHFSLNVLPDMQLLGNLDVVCTDQFHPGNNGNSNSSSSASSSSSTSSLSSSSIASSSSASLLSPSLMANNDGGRRSSGYSKAPVSPNSRQPIHVSRSDNRRSTSHKFTEHAFEKPEEDDLLSSTRQLSQLALNSYGPSDPSL